MKQKKSLPNLAYPQKRELTIRDDRERKMVECVEFCLKEDKAYLLALGQSNGKTLQTFVNGNKELLYYMLPHLIVDGLVAQAGGKKEHRSEIVRCNLDRFMEDLKDMIKQKGL